MGGLAVGMDEEVEVDLVLGLVRTFVLEAGLLRGWCWVDGSWRI
jgi:hypothetical protein